MFLVSAGFQDMTRHDTSCHVIRRNYTQVEEKYQKRHGYY